MDRRSFIGFALSSLGLEVFRLMGEQHPDPLPIKLDPPPLNAKIMFGDLGVVIGEQGLKDKEALKIHTPWYKDHIRGTYVMQRHTEVNVAQVACPKSVFEEICKTYGDVTKAGTNPPVKVYVQDKLCATLDCVIIQAVGYCVQAQDFVLVESLSFVGVWKELRDAIEKYEQAQAREAHFQKVLLDSNAAVAEEEVVPFVVHKG